MTPEYLRFIKVRGNKLQVCTLSWKGPHTPIGKWVTVEALSSSLGSLDVEAIDSFNFGDTFPAEEKIEAIDSFNFGDTFPVEEKIKDFEFINFDAKESLKAVVIEPLDMEAIISRLLKNNKYFGFCEICNEHKIKGYMHSDAICDSCAQIKFGFVH